MYGVGFGLCALDFGHTAVWAVGTAALGYGLSGLGLTVAIGARPWDVGHGPWETAELRWSVFQAFKEIDQHASDASNVSKQFVGNVGGDHSCIACQH